MSDRGRTEHVADKPAPQKSTSETRGVTTAAEAGRAAPAMTPAPAPVAAPAVAVPQGAHSAEGRFADQRGASEEPEGNQTADERALDAIPRTGPIVGDDPEANPSHPSSLRADPDGALRNKSTRARRFDPLVQPPGFEQGESPRATPSHPSSLRQLPGGQFALIDANAEKAESTADHPADVSPEREALVASERRGEETVHYTGSEAVTVIVPESGGATGLITAGATYNFRPGEAKAVPAKHAAWLRKHPTLAFEK